MLFRHPAVTDVAVIGLSDEKWGETEAAIVELAADENLDLDGSRSFCGDTLARYKLPRRLEIVEKLPRNAAGERLRVEPGKRFGDSQ